jgi:hypothetical protein
MLKGGPALISLAYEPETEGVAPTPMNNSLHKIKATSVILFLTLALITLALMILNVWTWQGDKAHTGTFYPGLVALIISVRGFVRNSRGYLRERGRDGWLLAALDLAALKYVGAVVCVCGLVVLWRLLLLLTVGEVAGFVIWTRTILILGGTLVAVPGLMRPRYVAVIDERN